MYTTGFGSSLEKTLLKKVAEGCEIMQELLVLTKTLRAKLDVWNKADDREDIENDLVTRIVARLAIIDTVRINNGKISDKNVKQLFDNSSIVRT